MKKATFSKSWSTWWDRGAMGIWTLVKLRKDKFKVYEEWQPCKDAKTTSKKAPIAKKPSAKGASVQSLVVSARSEFRESRIAFPGFNSLRLGASEGQGYLSDRLPGLQVVCEFVANRLRVEATLQARCELTLRVGPLAATCELSLRVGLRIGNPCDARPVTWCLPIRCEFNVLQIASASSDHKGAEEGSLRQEQAEGPQCQALRQGVG